MINAKLVMCGLCHSYYADPRQIPCSHSFCFDCICGRFNEETLTLTCPKCEKLHQYSSFDEFQNRCMRDGFLASMVTQFKKDQSRLSGLASRPSSTISHNPLTVPSTPVPLTSKQELHPLNHSVSQCSTPSITSQPATRALIAKCQSCNIRGELIVCSHCDNVICIKCSSEHRTVINDDVKREWDACKARFETINEKSIRFDNEAIEMYNKARNLQTLISKQSDQLIKTVETQKNYHMDTIEKHRQTYKQSFIHEQVVDEYESIDKRVGELFQSSDIDADKVNDFLFEIEHLEDRLNNLNNLLDRNELKFPFLSLPEQIDISSLFGSLEFTDVHTDSPSSQLTDSHRNSQCKSEDDEFDVINSSNLPENKIKYEQLSSSPHLQKKKLFWQIEYFSVPYYVRILGNQIFVCDKYGSLAIYRLHKSNDIRQKPSLQREIKLFKDNPGPTANDEDQTIIDSFVVYKSWIIVFKRKKNELHGTIYWFTFDGKLISNGKCVHNHPSRELTVDIGKNILWSLDQKQLALFYYNLPELKSLNPEECLQTRHSHVQFSKPFAPIHISVNQNALAVLDKNRQAIHVYDKRTKQEIYEYVNVHNESTHFCWDMALFSDNSLLIKLDEMSTLKSGPSKHVYYQLDASPQHNIIGLIEELDAYGMMITPTDEILIGIRVNTKGIVKCYV
ncbi:unnamed protein product [Adineta ricciae]|uniref:RING-type domain-containing protein n=1 Tax=Adineta ricciae TaxID=249248 RepID=A0A814ZRY0_ADIRI|nr:unnamed protein product [Adineta ricciae]CAF1247343.1 unnamed protein product [Adineta ricciae]